MKKVVLVLLLVAMVSIIAFGFAPKPPWCWGKADHCNPGPQATAGIGPPPPPGWHGWNGCPGCRGPHSG